MKEDISGKAGIQVKGKGDNLDMRTLGALPARLVVQLRNTTNAVCWQATYGTFTKQDASQLKAKSD